MTNSKIKVSLSLSQNAKADLLHMIESETPQEIKRQLLDIEDEAYRHRLIAIWAVHYGFSDIFKHAIPPKPRELLDWESRSPEYRKRSPFNWENDLIKDWLDKKGKAQNQNTTNGIWLRELKGWLDKDKDSDEVIAITNKQYHMNSKDRDIEVKAIQREWT